MPELAELKLTADFINRSAKDRIFHDVWKNPAHKGNEIKIAFPFSIEAVSRGKELILQISTAGDFATEDNMEFLPLKMTMGMSGHFQWAQSGNKPKHTHLSFESEAGSLCFVDVRRFGRWGFGWWNPDRSPDPTTDYNSFEKNIRENVLTSKEFKKPIHEVLMNQKYFNGIGNYLRAEILYRTECNPFISAEEAIVKYPEILSLCKDIPLLAYSLGGGRLKDWKNPNGEEPPKNWGEFMKCYAVKGMEKVLDKNGRTFWYDPKWK
jgi:endonuclease VIII-like 1